MVRQLDNNEYADADLMELKVPMHLPYNTDWKEYERYNGEIVVEGVHYNYVKRKISSDTMYLLCMPNHDKTLLYNTKQDIAREISDIPSGNQRSSESALKKMTPLNEYDFAVSSLLMELPSPEQSGFSGLSAPHLYSSFVPDAAQPPETIV